MVTNTPSKILSKGEQEQLKSDLNSQGMNSLSELAWFILTLHGGRPATASGTAGACYLQSPTEMPGGVLLRKAKARVYTEVLHDASISGSAVEHDRWLTSLMDRLDHAPVEYGAEAAGYSAVEAGLRTIIPLCDLTSPQWRYDAFQPCVVGR